MNRQLILWVFAILVAEENALVGCVFIGWVTFYSKVNTLISLWRIID